MQEPYTEGVANHCGPESCAARWPWTNESQSLTQHIARTLSKALKEQQLPSVEGGFISHNSIEEMKFRGNTSLSALNIKQGLRFFDISDKTANNWLNTDHTRRDSVALGVAG